MRDLRQYTADPDPDTIDGQVKTAELTSTNIKKSLLWVSDEPKNDVPRIDPGDVLRALNAIKTGRICPICGFPHSTEV